MRELERVIMLRVVDEYWMDHIDAMTELRQGVVKPWITPALSKRPEV